MRLVMKEVFQDAQLHDRSVISSIVLSDNGCDLHMISRYTAFNYRSMAQRKTLKPR